MALDTCEGQKSGTVKTQAAKLFEALTDNISGALTLTTYYSLQAVNITISKESSKPTIDLSYFSESTDATQLQVIDRCAFLMHSKDDVIVESSLLVIGLLSYVHARENYAHLSRQMNIVLAHYNEDLLASDSKLVRVRYALLLGYLIDMMYKDEPPQFGGAIIFLLKSVMLQGEDTAIALQSIDTLSNVIGDGELKNRIVSCGLVD